MRFLLPILAPDNHNNFWYMIQNSMIILHLPLYSRFAAVKIVIEDTMAGAKYSPNLFILTPLGYVRPVESDTIWPGKWTRRNK